MSTVTTTLKLNDEMTQALKNIINQLEEVEQGAEEAKQATKQLEESSRGLGRVFDVLTVSAGNLVSAGLQKIVGAIGGMARTAFDYVTDMENSLTNFTVLLGNNTDLAEQKIAELRDFAKSTPFEMGDLTSATQTLLAFGVENEKTTETLRMIGDVALGNAEKFSGLVLAFGQISAQGKLSGEDLNQMIERGFNPLLVISEKTGKSMAELKDEMSKGAISAEMVAEAFQIATSEGGQFFGGMEKGSQTLSGRISTLKDTFAQFLGEGLAPLQNIMKWFVDLGITVLDGLMEVQSAIQEVFASIGDFFAPFVEILRNFGITFTNVINVIKVVFSGLANFIREHAEQIKVILLAVGAVLLGMFLKVAITAIVALAPVILTILAIAGVIYVVIKALKAWGVTVESVIGFVVGVFYWFGALVNNIMYGIVWVVVEVINAFSKGWASIKNWWNDFWTGLFSDAINGFWDFIGSILDGLENIAGKIDRIFKTDLAGKVGGLKDWAEGKRQSGLDWVSSKDVTYDPMIITMEELGMQYQDMTDAFSEGYSVGHGWASDFWGKKEGEGDGFEDLPEITADQGVDLGATNDELKGLNKKLGGSGSLKSVGETKIVDENLRYLRDIAFQRYQQDYQKAPITINAPFNASGISGDVDLNKAFNRFENTLVEAISQHLA